ncbi:hypothetical protein [Oceanibaculum indicum]|uniref:Uncharacterized protein n=1 Tax=Oceanibaculum indicum P24 TaxID=1207063 RepID=K2J5R6_9PROT|nr:hypothetical protein [Oceanibaculum indicum]EKE78421.1 hypothetical protein P24_02636 [Oceanibaculum indicum P24]
MPAIEIIELLSEVATYDGRLTAVCSCGHQGDIDVPAILRKPRVPVSEIKRLGGWIRCKRCGGRHPTLRLTLPDGQQRDYYRAFGAAH